MISTITESVSYKVENEVLRYSHTFKNKDVAEATEKYLQSVINILEYLNVDLSDKDIHVDITTLTGKVRFESITTTYRLSPDREGHHPNGSISTNVIPSSSYLDRIARKAFLDKVKKAYKLPNEWNKFLAIRKDCELVFPFTKKLDVIYNCSYISIAGVKLFDF